MLCGPYMKTTNNVNFENRCHQLSRNNTIADIWENNNESEIKNPAVRPIDLKKIKRVTKAGSQ